MVSTHVTQQVCRTFLTVLEHFAYFPGQHCRQKHRYAQTDVCSLAGIMDTVTRVDSRVGPHLDTEANLAQPTLRLQCRQSLPLAQSPDSLISHQQLRLDTAILLVCTDALAVCCSISWQTPSFLLYTHLLAFQTHVSTENVTLQA